ncbi:hypothetical protein [Subtercola sp. YIM 133946]|uniref:hypothetical protein n=1 Tax=Subtercola sp. YIM 133946 TaxID=3118909 RepID=UPI002F94DB9A
MIAEMAAVFEGLTNIQKHALYAEISSVMQLAQEGGLTPQDEVKKIAQDPVLWELRWNVDGKQYRLYHAEPSSDLSILVSLRFHLKDTSGDPLSVTARQNGEIQRAILRYHDPDNTLWGNIENPLA